MDPTSPVVMISGANRGIGAAIAEALHAAGWRVSLGCRTAPEDPLERDGWLVCHYDALDADSGRAWVERTVAEYGRLDALVNNAGILSRSTVLDASGEEFDQLMAVNVRAPMLLTQQAWPHLVAAEQGKVISIVSLSGKRVKSAHSGLYAMSKFAAQAFVYGLRHCSAETRVRATAICPGPVATDMAIEGGLDGGDITRPEEIARVVTLVLELPPTAGIAEIPINWQVEPTV
ncbi:SDR family NAD(P)-dependent oxidoreductase [Salinicola avicenniae]|uniref:SDR family NAD(P)-dependent oxidoreductase n=1 Tax=Salinicola avicenniae TaxID=2916836 RepID=UPI002072C2FF|nr:MULTISPECIES: SDR family NAD(P)-dependent oxidoreductase [unclassified Salinicola]